MFYSIRLKMMFQSVLEDFANLRQVNNLCFGPNVLLRGTEVAKMVSQQKHPFDTIRPKMMYGSFLKHFRNLWHVKRCKTCVSGLNALFRGTEVAKIVSHLMHPFYSIGPKMMFGSVLEHFGNIRHVKDAKLVVRA